MDLLRASLGFVLKDMCGNAVLLVLYIYIYACTGHAFSTVHKMARFSENLTNHWMAQDFAGTEVLRRDSDAAMVE